MPTNRNETVESSVFRIAISLRFIIIGPLSDARLYDWLFQLSSKLFMTVKQSAPNKRDKNETIRENSKMLYLEYSTDHILIIRC